MQKLSLEAQARELLAQAAAAGDAWQGRDGVSAVAALFLGVCWRADESRRHDGTPLTMALRY